jgi:hypothetical protein
VPKQAVLGSAAVAWLDDHPWAFNWFISLFAILFVLGFFYKRKKNEMLHEELQNLVSSIANEFE